MTQDESMQHIVAAHTQRNTTAYLSRNNDVGKQIH